MSASVASLIVMVATTSVELVYWPPAIPIVLSVNSCNHAENWP